MNPYLVSPAFLRPFVAAVVLFGAALSSAFADVVTDWNLVMTSYSESLPPPGLPPFVEARIYAMTHVAILDAVREAHSSHTPASPEAAAAQAAHDVLVNQFPGGAAGFDAQLVSSLAAITNGPAKTKGIAIGVAEAAEVLAARANDGAATAEGPYVPGSNPGDYQFTPPFDGPPFNGYAAVPKWGQVTPFSLKSGHQFRVPPPYKVTDLAYTFDYNEIKALGSVASTLR